MNWTRFICFYSLLMVTQVAPTWGQQFTRPENKIAREGNLLYKNGSFEDATKKYQESLQTNNQNAYSNYNMGTTLFKMGKADSALTYFNNAIHQTDNKTLKSKAFYNAGNVFLQKKEYAKAIEQYKNSLKVLPNNEDARYNLKYAQQLLQQQQQQQQQNQQNQDQQKEQKDEQKDEQKNNNQQQNNDNKDEQKDKQDQQAADQNNLSKEQAERMLNAIENKEKELQKKYNEQQNATRRNNEKNW